MFSRFGTLKRITIGLSSVALCTAIYQGQQARSEYKGKKRLAPPTGPYSGIIEWKDNVHEKLTNIKNEIIAKKEILEQEESKLKEKIDEMLHEWKLKAIAAKNKIINDKILDLKNTNRESTSSEKLVPPKKKAIKLLLIGDSLACGVGCEGGVNGPELPNMLAKLFSVAFQREIEWYCTGEVGATASDISNNLLPRKRGEIINTLFPTSQSFDVKADSKLVVVVLCGLNDWRSSLESFPRGSGPITFQSNLNDIVSEVKSIAEDVNCDYQVFFPALPINYIASDPRCFFTQRPLRDVVEFISWMWDQQKLFLASDVEKTWYISVPQQSPTVSGKGLVSSDRVHPSVLGYQAWAVHIAKEIVPLVD